MSFEITPCSNNTTHPVNLLSMYSIHSWDPQSLLFYVTVCGFMDGVVQSFLKKSFISFTSPWSPLIWHRHYQYWEFECKCTSNKSKAWWHFVAPTQTKLRNVSSYFWPCIWKKCHFRVLLVCSQTIDSPPKKVPVDMADSLTHIYSTRILSHIFTPTSTLTARFPCSTNVIYGSVLYFLNTRMNSRILKKEKKKELIEKLNWATVHSSITVINGGWKSTRTKYSSSPLVRVHSQSFSIDSVVGVW